tara:strand:+ start:3654 stop:4112 length:459 start_codon:yes stop_codon:yes gene_type:complete
MAYFAKLSDQNKVLQVLAVENSHMGDPENEANGQAHLESIHGWPAAMWKQCSYNTKAGKHWDMQSDPTKNIESEDQSKAFRGNFPGVGFVYDSVNDKFHAPQPHAGWVLNQTTWCWEAPTPMPDDGNMYLWNDSTESWDGPYTAADNPFGAV